MREEIQKIVHAAQTQIREARNFAELEVVRADYLGRKRGKLTAILKRIPHLPLAERREAGAAANDARRVIEHALKAKHAELASRAQGAVADFDATEPGIVPEVGHLHILTREKRQIAHIFQHMGFWVTEGPHVETDWYNFQALNLPPDHPARDMWDTFWIKSQNSKVKTQKLLLRTHGSPIQIHMMEKYKPPFAAVDIGRVFRHEATDASHEHTFDEIEGLFVDTKVTMAELHGFLAYFISEYFQKPVQTRLRPAYFPFVEPGAELIIQCIICEGKGCSVCKKTGFLELLGCGMIHPAVFKAVRYPVGKYSGFAFGIGVQRLVMMKYQIPDIRLFYQNDLRFLRQW
jgi:phenylalanyl-tRNA synthetase alpha chain